MTEWYAALTPLQQGIVSAVLLLFMSPVVDTLLRRPFLILIAISYGATFWLWPLR